MQFVGEYCNVTVPFVLDLSTSYRLSCVKISGAQKGKVPCKRTECITKDLVIRKNLFFTNTSISFQGTSSFGDHTVFPEILIISGSASMY